MIRSKVDFPDPDRPSRATISPARSCRSMESRTRSSSPAAPGKLLLTASTSMRTSACERIGEGVVISVAHDGEPGRSEGVAALCQCVEAPPEQAVHRDDVEAHHEDADEDVR